MQGVEVCGWGVLPPLPTVEQAAIINFKSMSIIFSVSVQFSSVLLLHLTSEQRIQLKFSINAVHIASSTIHMFDIDCINDFMSYSSRHIPIRGARHNNFHFLSNLFSLYLFQTSLYEGGADNQRIHGITKNRSSLSTAIRCSFIGYFETVSVPPLDIVNFDLKHHQITTPFLPSTMRSLQENVLCHIR